MSSPRFRGGTGYAAPLRPQIAGLSPRRRGNRRHERHREPRIGSIPAQAGEPCSRARLRRAARVYPRAGGGTTARVAGLMTLRGLSPRRRGNLDQRVVHAAPVGSIRRGTAVRGARAAAAGVYPRAGGGTSRRTTDAGTAGGLSPRRRGNRSSRRRRRGSRGSIPAQAGEPERGRAILGIGSIPSAGIGYVSLIRVYPRAGGGTTRQSRTSPTYTGLSPRRRGNRVRVHLRDRRTGSIPAQAGEPSAASTATSRSRVYPRAGGGTPCYQVVELSAMSKNVARVELRLSAFYEQNPICVHDLFRGFTESLDAKIPDGLRIAPDEDDRPRTKRFPPS